MSKTMIRVSKKTSFAVIDKTCLNDENLSWKAKGLLCYLLSLPDDWQIYQEELSKHAKDGLDSTRSAIKELIDNKYISRTRERDKKGHLKEYSYTVFEAPTDIENVETSENKEFEPKRENPILDMPNLDNRKLLNNNITNNNITNNQSINQREEEKKKEIDGLIETYPLDFFRDRFETSIMEQSDRLYTQLTELVYDVVNSTAAIKVNGSSLPSEVVRSRFLKLDISHLQYVVDAFDKQTNKITNVRQYLITALYNSYTTIDGFYNNAVRSD